MIKYIAVRTNNGVQLVEAAKTYYTPAGWHEGRTCQYLDLAHGAKLSKPQYRQPEKRNAEVSIPGVLTDANNARVVDDATTQAIDHIDSQIRGLIRRRREMVTENFLTFRLVQETDLQVSGTKVFTTKTEASSKRS